MTRLTLVIVGIAIASRAAAEGGQDGRQPEPPPIGPQRYTEDYTYLADPRNRSGAWWEPLKLVPLNAEGTAYLSFGDDLRLRYEHYWNNNFGSGKLPTEDYLRYRELPYFSVAVGQVRVFVQSQIAYAARSHLTKNPFLDQTAVDFVQGFVDWRVPFGTGALTLRAGRQVLLYGSGRLINQGPNIRTSFDGGVASWEQGPWRVDALYARPVDPGPGYFDDWPHGARRLWGVYATRKLPRFGPDGGLDLYYLGYENKQAKFNQGRGIELRHSVGARFFGANDPWQWDIEGIFQFGTFGDSDIRAYAIATDEGITFASLPLRPMLLFRIALLSGDGNPRDHSLGTFNPMFAEGGYFGENAVLGPANLFLIRPLLALEVARGVGVAVSGTVYFRARLGDGIYDLAINPLRPDGGSDGRLVGTQADLSIAWAVNRNLSFVASGSILWPSKYVQDTGPALTVYFFGTHMEFTW